MKTAIFIFFILGIHIACAQKNRKSETLYDPDKKYRPEELHFDLAVLRDALVKAHPGLFWHQSEAEFESNCSRIKSAIGGPMTDRQFYILIAPFVGSIKCSHTDLILSEEFGAYFENSQKLFPFGIRIIESKLYLAGNYTNDSTILTGSEIIMVNGISADSILRFMKPHTWADGFAESNARIESNFGIFLYLSGFFNNANRYILHAIDPRGNSIRIETEALDYKIFEERCSGYGIKTGPFHFRLIDSLSTGIIKIDAFEGRGYLKFLENAFMALKRNNSKHLIIDLRQNEGGEDGYGKLLYSYIALKEYRYYDHLEMTVDHPNDTLFKYGAIEGGMRRFKFFHMFKLNKTGKGNYEFKNSAHENLSKKPFKPHKNNFRGNVYVLTDDKSFSATTEFCAIAQYNKRAKFIGRETGGGYCGNTSGFGFILTLPKTGIRVYIPLVRYYSAVEGPCGRGVMPDYPLKENPRDLILKNDSGLQFTLDLIKHSQ